MHVTNHTGRNSSNRDLSTLTETSHCRVETATHSTQHLHNPQPLPDEETDKGTDQPDLALPLLLDKMIQTLNWPMKTVLHYLAWTGAQLNERSDELITQKLESSTQTEAYSHVKKQLRDFKCWTTLTIYWEALTETSQKKFEKNYLFIYLIFFSNRHNTPRECSIWVICPEVLGSRSSGRYLSNRTLLVCFCHPNKPKHIFFIFGCFSMWIKGPLAAAIRFLWSMHPFWELRQFICAAQWLLPLNFCTEDVDDNRLCT